MYATASTANKRSQRRATTPPLDPILHYAVFESQLGWMGCIWQGEVLDGVTFGHRNREAAREACLKLSETSSIPWLKLQPADQGAPFVAAMIERMQRFAAGADDDFLDIELNVKSATPFQQKVTKLCRRIRSGQALSYGELATKAGSPGAARAVGSVMSKNRFPLIVPCHRVLASGGALGGYSAPEGLAMKRRLLEREGIAVRKS